MNIKNSIQLIGNTPLVKINLGIQNISVLAKLESYNLTGSIKDRMALYMVKKARKRGFLKKGFIVIEATTGNTGIALAALSSLYAYKFIAIMPKDVSVERAKIIKSFGAKVILTSKNKGPMGAIYKRNKIASKTLQSWMPMQFSNPDNIKAHERGIGKEILDQTGGKIDYIVHGAGTGGTLMEISKVVKRFNPNIKIVAVEPEESAVLSGGKASYHGIQGIGEGFVPPLVDRKMIDIIVKISTRKAVTETKMLINTHGLLVGFSSGANIAAIKELARNIREPATIVTIFADRGERYLSILSRPCRKPGLLNRG